jgi:azurin
MKELNRFATLCLVVGTGVISPGVVAAQAGMDTVTVEINAIPGIKFDRVRFQAPPGAPVKIVFSNRDDLADMDHNVVVTRPGARMEVVQAGMQATVENAYVPRIPQVLAATPLVKQGESFTLRFVAPTEPGAYPYVCTFPGHGYVMYGVMYVGQEMPRLAVDENVPPAQRSGEDMPVGAAASAAGGAAPAAGGPGRPGGAPGGRRAGPPPAGPPLSYGTTFPAVSRTFMPESGPASIAVGFEDGQAFNFDAGAGYLRYAWAGGFVDNWPHWAGNGNAYATLKGEIFYRNAVGVPLRIGNREEAGKVEFKGYRLGDDDIPEFRYLLDGAEVREKITPRNGGGLVRTFHIQATEPVRLVTEGDTGVTYESSAGRWQAGVLTLTPAQAREFTVTMIPSTGGSR